MKGRTTAGQIPTGDRKRNHWLIHHHPCRQEERFLFRPLHRRSPIVLSALPRPAELALDCVTTGSHPKCDRRPNDSFSLARPYSPCFRSLH